jgi:hypothetical protein
MELEVAYKQTHRVRKQNTATTAAATIAAG